MAFNRVALAGLSFGIAAVGACTSVRRIQPVEYLADNSPEVVWVTDTSNSVLPVADAEIKRDTLKGTWQGARVKIPLGGIRSVQTRVHDHTKTALLLTTLGAVAVTSFYFVLAAQGGAGGPGGVYCPNDVKGRPLGYC